MKKQSIVSPIPEAFEAYLKTLKEFEETNKANDAKKKLKEEGGLK